MNLSSQWNRLNHNQKRTISIALAVGVLFAAVVLFGKTTDEPSTRAKAQEEAIRSVLTDRSTRNLSIDSLSANMQIVVRENDELRKQMAKIAKDLEVAKKSDATSVAVNKRLSELQNEVERLQAFQTEQAEIYLQAQADLSSRDMDKENEITEEKAPAVAQVVDTPQTVDEVFSKLPAPKPQRDFDERTGEPLPLKIVSYSQPKQKEKDSSTEEQSVYMPSGSILTGVLLNGLDAPTGKGARKDPFPATLRIQKEAILPNRFQADVKECFMIVSGYGDLSTERAYLRGEVISCVRDDGGVIEARLNSYVVGEDGKVGVRGRLVSKQGQVIAKSLMAGFMSGMASAFDVNPVPVLNTSPDGRTQYQRTFSDDMLQGAAMKGASTALDRVAKFYIDMAESMFPVVEIDAGRQVDVIVTGGVSLKIRS